MPDDHSPSQSIISQHLSVEVAYATPERQKIIVLEVEPGCTALAAAEQSGITQYFPEIDLAVAKIGVFGKTVKADQYRLKASDRVEIYRPLLADPKALRKARADKAKASREQS